MTFLADRPVAWCRLWLLAAFAVLLAAPGCGPRLSADDYLAQGDAYFADEAYPRAIIAYRNAINEEPEHGLARRHLADAYMRAGRSLEAVGQMIRAADLLDDPEYDLEVASLLLVGEQFENARARAEKVIASDPSNVRARIIVANAMAGLRQFEDALSQLEEAVAIEPTFARTYSNLGVLQLAQGQRERAEEAFLQAVEIDDGSVESRLALANFYWSDGRFGEAESVLHDALDRAPDHVIANNALARLYLVLGQLADAEVYLRAAVEASQGPEPRLALADYLIITNRPDEARDVLRPIEEFPDAYVDAQGRLAELDHSQGDAERAHERLDEILERVPFEYRALEFKARWFYEEGLDTQALEFARRAVAARPTSVPARYALGTIQKRRRQFIEASQAFRQVLRANPAAFQAEIALAQVLVDIGDYDEARDTALRVLTTRPDNVDALLVVCRVFLEARSLDEADRYVTRLRDLYPNLAAAHAYAGTLSMARGDTVAAGRSFERTIELDPSQLGAFAGLVQLDIGADRRDAAVGRLEARLAEYPQDSATLLVAGQLYASLGDLGEAENLLRRTIERDPANLTAYAILGQILYDQGRLAEALAEFTAAAEQRPDSVSAPTMVGILHYIEGRLADAKSWFDQALFIDPEAPVPANNLAYLLAEERDNLDLAARLARVAVAELPDHPDVNDTMGWVYYQQGQAARAIPFFVRSLRSAPDNAIVLYHLALAQRREGQMPAARASLERALELVPDLEPARSALRQLTTR